METQVKLFIENDHKQNQEKIDKLQATHMNEMSVLHNRIQTNEQTISK